MEARLVHDLRGGEHSKVLSFIILYLSLCNVHNPLALFQTSKGHLIIYHIVVPTDIKTLYEQVDIGATSMKRESDELFLKELIPPLIFSLAFEVDIEGGVSDLVAIREELMIATTDGRDGVRH